MVVVPTQVHAEVAGVDDATAQKLADLAHEFCPCARGALRRSDRFRRTNLFCSKLKKKLEETMEQMSRHKLLIKDNPRL